MAHQLLHYLIEVASVFYWAVAAAIVLFWIAGWVEHIWLGLRRRSSLDCDRYQAEQALRSIKRRAMREMLTVESEYRRLGGTDEAVGVRR
jgi:hypothetical protein